MTRIVVMFLALLFCSVAPVAAQENSAGNQAVHTPRIVRASWYGRKNQGKRMANGKRFDMYRLTAAHKTLPLKSKVELENPENGKTVVVKVTDRGPFSKGRDIDLSWAAARRLGITKKGVAEIRVVAVFRGS